MSAVDPLKIRLEPTSSFWLPTKILTLLQKASLALRMVIVTCGCDGPMCHLYFLYHFVGRGIGALQLPPPMIGGDADIGVRWKASSKKVDFLVPFGSL